MTQAKPRKQTDAQTEITALDLHPSDVAERRTNDLLRSLLATPPEPFTPKAKAPKKRAGK